MEGQEYEVYVTLDMPESPSNIEAGLYTLEYS